MRRRWSLITRLMAWQVLASLLALLLLTGFIMFEKLKAETGFLDERMRFFASMLLSVATSEAENTPGLARRVDRLQAALDDAFKSIEYEGEYPMLAQVFGHQGQLIYASPGLPTAARLLPNAQYTPSSPATAQAAMVFSTGLVAGSEHRLLQVRSADGHTTLVMAESIAARRAVIWPLMANLALKQMVVLLLCLGALWWATRGMLRPLSQLTTQLSQRQAGTLTPFDVQAADHEVALLVKHLNQLMQAQAQQRDMERGFLADAAHELRTPMAMLAAQAHLVLNAADETTRAHAGQALRLGITCASHTLSQLLTVARIDATTSADKADACSPYAHKEAINLSELLAERVAQFAFAARAKFIDLELQAPEQQQVWANSAALHTILDNLIDNAVRYTPAGGQVMVSLSPRDDAVQVRVQDNGPGIAPEHQARVFERFYRVPGNLAPGSGLGLAIAQAVADTQGAVLKLGAGLQGQGLGASLTLPASTQQL